MKYKDFVKNNLTNANQMVESLIKGLDNRNISAAEVYRMLINLQRTLNATIEKIDLEHE